MHKDSEISQEKPNQVRVRSPRYDSFKAYLNRMQALGVQDGEWLTGGEASKILGLSENFFRQSVHAKRIADREKIYAPALGGRSGWAYFFWIPGVSREKSPEGSLRFVISSKLSRDGKFRSLEYDLFGIPSSEI